VWTNVSPAAAQRFLGHKYLTTTDKYYSIYLGPVGAVEAPAGV
jgi:hypothetical protein